VVAVSLPKSDAVVIEFGIFFLVIRIAVIADQNKQRLIRLGLVIQDVLNLGPIRLMIALDRSHDELLNGVVFTAVFHRALSNHIGKEGSRVDLIPDAEGD